MSALPQSARPPLYKALADYKSALIGVGCFTALINVLMLAPSIYMLQVYDRVLTSQNQTTLAMLTLMVVGFFAFIGLLEMVRSFVVIRIGSELERRFNLRVYQAAFESNLHAGQRQAGQALGDLTFIRQFLTGPALFAFFDAPWFPIYLAVIFLFDPWLGVLASVGTVLLVGLACLNEWLTRKPLAERVLAAVCAIGDPAPATGRGDPGDGHARSVAASLVPCAWALSGLAKPCQ
ncbi:ABC-type protease exporter, ATP-binding component PrtD/AprD [Pseudomonas savastanoi]|uniref:ABC-type protease exporter, ATP-binding component PrtD/AprD n=1 Tax=Pseudomonas savastanoi TaxID=29438 RepID=A0A3M6AI15_PSESS|nr:ABC-type protease exporter, ATP-binding component PrtD/AprD [Pseudomonas savastanoi]